MRIACQKWFWFIQIVVLGGYQRLEEEVSWLGNYFGLYNQLDGRLAGVLSEGLHSRCNSSTHG